MSSITLTPDQRKVLEQGEPVRVTDSQTQIECVVIRADVYERAKILPPDIDPRETYAAVDDVFREDWSDPKMAGYDDYESRRP